MHVEYAQLPPPEDSADRIFITDNAIIVLDGATAFSPTDVSAQAYADHLGRRLITQLNTNPTGHLADALATAIAVTARDLELVATSAPSSTVAILRKGLDAFDILVLGDSPVLLGSGDEWCCLVDDRIDRIGEKYREEYRDRLRSGHGYDQRHQEILRTLQAEQRSRRNVSGGYWIAEADPAAAYEALTASIPSNSLNWALLATDGAFDPLEQQDRRDWNQIARYSSDQLGQLLQELSDWESTNDANGLQVPRAKRHDDKLLAVTKVDPRTT